jgi:CHAT domain-containing protein
LFSSTQKIKNNILNSEDKNLIRKFEEWQFERDKIAKLYRLSKQQLKDKFINLDSVIATANDKEKELSRLAEGFSDAYQKKQIKFEEVQSKLSKDEAAIEIVRFRYYDKNWTDTIYYAALIIKKNSKHPELVLFKNGNDLETKYIKNYKRSILNQLEDKDSYNQFWEPIAKKLKGIKKVYISPDGVYNQINLATLMNPKTEHYLSDDLDIRVVTSTRDLVERHTPKSPFDKGEHIVELFGDPMFNLDSTKHLELASAISENRTRDFYYLGNTLDSTTRGGIMPLPSTRTEIEQIANEFTKKGWKVNSHLGEKALEEAVKGVDNPKVLHIATHGKFLKDVEVKDDDRMLGMETKRVAENPLLRSFLLFSGAENTLNEQKLDNQNTDDGLLTAYEAMNLNLDKTDLVVLSACETGLGEIKNGEGVYGLQRAFQQAGAKSIIMSLWTVPDKETQELMTSFYTKWLNGKDKRTAFNEARNEMRDKYHYPYYWGGFVMVGE